MFARGEHVGYLKASQNAQISAWMDAVRQAKGADAALAATLARKDGKWPMVEVET